MRKCGSCGAGASDSALKCPECRAWLVSTSPPGVSPPTQVGVAADPGRRPHHRRRPVRRDLSRRRSGTNLSAGPARVRRGVDQSAACLPGAFLVYAAVHGYRENGNPYSHAAQESFVSGCTRGGANEDMCRCMFGWMRQNVPDRISRRTCTSSRRPVTRPRKRPCRVDRRSHRADPRRNGRLRPRLPTRPG